MECRLIYLVRTASIGRSVCIYDSNASSGTSALNR